MNGNTEKDAYDLDEKTHDSTFHIEHKDEYGTHSAETGQAEEYPEALANMPHAHPEIEMPDPVTIADVREIAQKRLDPAAWDYYITGADDEQTVVRNETIFKK